MSSSLLPVEAASDIIEYLLLVEHPLEAEMIGLKSLQGEAAGLILLLDKANALFRRASQPIRSSAEYLRWNAGDLFPCMVADADVVRWREQPDK
eukprot:scaffold7400_cov122-Skeletonema_menzelii.AAC.5